MKLNVEERLLLINIFPKKGDYPEVRLSKDTFVVVEFTVREQEELEFNAVFKCEDCGVTNVELIREFAKNQKGIQRTDLGRGLKPGEAIVTKKEATEIMRNLVCPKCYGVMRQAGHQLLWSKVKRKGKIGEMVKNLKFSKESLGMMRDCLQKPVKTGKALPVVITLYHKVLQELRK